jgi:hypothetical protein
MKFDTEKPYETSVLIPAINVTMYETLWNPSSDMAVYKTCVEPLMQHADV